MEFLRVLVLPGETEKPGRKTPKRTQQQASELPFCYPNWKKNDKGAGLVTKQSGPRMLEIDLKLSWLSSNMSSRKPFRAF